MNVNSPATSTLHSANTGVVPPWLTETPAPNTGIVPPWLQDGYNTLPVSPIGGVASSTQFVRESAIDTSPSLVAALRAR